MVGPGAPHGAPICVTQKWAAGKLAARPTIHVFSAKEVVDGRDKRDHDDRVNDAHGRRIHPRLRSRSMRWEMAGWVAKSAPASSSKCSSGFSI
jgi:hypothetical protein